MLDSDEDLHLNGNLQEEQQEFEQIEDLNNHGTVKITYILSYAPPPTLNKIVY